MDLDLFKQFSSITNNDSDGFKIFELHIAKTLEITLSLKKDDQIRALLLLNALVTKLQSLVQKDDHEILNRPSSLANVEDDTGRHIPGRRISQQSLLENRVDVVSLQFPSSRNLTVLSSFHGTTPTTANASCEIGDEDVLPLDEDEDRAIDKVLDEVIHLEAETEMLCQLKSAVAAAQSAYLEETITLASTSHENDTQNTSNISSASLPVIIVAEPISALSETSECPICHVSFNCKTEFRVHQENDHKQDVKIQIKQFKCPQCEYSYSTRGNLNVHLRTHTGEKPFGCGKCSARFTSSGNLRRHLLSHQGLKPYRCSICNSCFTEKKSLVIHQRRHNGEKPYACPHCAKRFTQNSILQSHLSVHSEEKKYFCNLCSKAFKQKSHLSRHLSYVHNNGVKKCVCTECGFQFVTKGDLKRHLQSHRGDKAFLCSKCGKRFMRQENLTEHINNHHNSTSE